MRASDRGICAALLEFVVDRVWPVASGPRAQSNVPPALPDGIHATAIACAEKVYEKRLEDIDRRFEGINARLLPLLALSSILSALLVAGIPLALTARAQDVESYQIVTVASLAVYVVVQLIRCLFAVIGGLQRRTFRSLSLQDMDPLVGDDELVYRRRLLDTKRRQIAANDASVDEKTTEMAIAHVAYQNALFALLIIVLVSAAFAAVNRFG